MSYSAQTVAQNSGIAVETGVDGSHRALQPLARKKDRYYRPELDVLRCLAFLIVFTSHMPATAHAAHGFSPLLVIEESGGAGVCVFFTLSAFLITELLLREKEETGTIHRAAFYIRRIRRPWPRCFVAVAISLVVPPVYHRWAAPQEDTQQRSPGTSSRKERHPSRFPTNHRQPPLWLRAPSPLWSALMLQ